ncbi:hypothetical protein Nepgr_005963 [Nepenthes gracilis]|uniref:Flavin-containing monooxygenase n=1 Tax=Nepenthes gracilis TaxID=150966 RepID=A0AAD3XGW9_NEPGR|nr:hypothetical protein Nepgr_005963 [Nepenthes gracilis]
MAVFQSKIAIIGAGISGIAAAKQLSTFSPVVFEASDSIGGVWRHASIRSTKLQTPRCDYEFSDFPWPDRDNSSFPSHIEIVDYLHAYAKHFDVLQFVRFNSKVVELRFVGEPGTLVQFGQERDYGPLLTGSPAWEVAVQTTGCDTIQWYEFEFVVVCIGKYGDIPRIPNLPNDKGPEIFEGKVLHTLDYCKLNPQEASLLLRGKKVAVVGYKKSAIDIAVECAEANKDDQPCNLNVHIDHRRLVSRIIEGYLLWRLPFEKHGLKPDHPFEEDYASCQMAILPENFFSEADHGRIKFKKTSKWWFWEKGLQFDDDSRLEADVVILATGYDGKQKLKAILPQPFSSFLEYVSGVMPLYRSTINPMIPNMAFVGYVETVSNLQAAELRCRWLAQLLANEFKLPSVEKMLEKIAGEVEIMKRATRFYKRHCISTFSINHNDEICEDMGWKPWRKNNWFSEAFSPYTSQDYEEERLETKKSAP